MASLVADYDSDENESDVDSDSDSNCELTDATNHIDGNLTSVGNKLPLPDFATSVGLPLTTSVFSNPFTEAERAKKAILEKHVKMTPTRNDTKMINGKKICWNFRKGRCRFGHNCKFAHDSDLHNSELQNGTEENGNSSEDPAVLNHISGAYIPTEDETQVDEEEIQNRPDKRKRPGLSQSLVPGKKVMKMYKKQSQNASVALSGKR